MWGIACEGVATTGCVDPTIARPIRLTGDRLDKSHPIAIGVGDWGDAYEMSHHVRWRHIDLPLAQFGEDVVEVLDDDADRGPARTIPVIEKRILGHNLDRRAVRNLPFRAGSARAVIGSSTEQTRIPSAGGVKVAYTDGGVNLVFLHDQFPNCACLAKHADAAKVTFYV